MSEPQILKTQHSQKSLPPQQQTYHVIPATVIQNHPQGNQSNVTNLTQKNLSIINRSENQIPSMHQQPKNHKQNQSQSSMNKIEQEKISQNQSKLTQHQNNQNQDDLDGKKDEKIKGLKPKQNHQKVEVKAKEQEEDKKLPSKNQQKQTKDKQYHQVKATEKQEEKHKEKKEQAHKQVKQDVNKQVKKQEVQKQKNEVGHKEEVLKGKEEAHKQTKKEEPHKEKKEEVHKEKKQDVKKQKKEEEVHKNKKEEPPHKQTKKEEPHKETKKEEPPHKQTKKDIANKEKKEVHKEQVLQVKKNAVHQTQNKIPSQHEAQQVNPINQHKSNKKVEKTPQVNQPDKKLQKKQQKVQDNSDLDIKQPVKQDEIQKQKNEKIIESVKQSKKAQQVSTKNQQSNQEKNQQKLEQKKVEKKEKNTIQQHQKKPQLKQKVLKEGNKEKNQKFSKIQKKLDAPIIHKAVPQDNKTNLSNLSLNWNKLAKSFIEKVEKIMHQNVKTKEAQNKKIDLNLELGSSQISSQNDYENRIKLEFKLYENRKIKENQVFAEGQNQDDKQNDQTQKHINRQKLPIKLSFSLYDLKNINQKDSQKTTHKINEQRLKSKLQEITNNFDKNQFSIKINENMINPINQQLSGKKQSQNKIQKARIDFRFSTDFISNQLKIKKDKVEGLKNILNKTSQIVGKEEKNIEGNLKKNTVNYTTFCQLLTTYPLKTIQPMKFLQLLLGGFKLRIYRENINNKDSQTQKINIEQTLYEVLLSLFPQQIYQYIEKVSGGVGKIKFRSIQNLTKLLTRLGINEMLGETPTVKELLHELIQNLKKLFFVYEQKKKQKEGLKKSSQQQQQHQKLSLSQLWKVFESVLQECKSNGIEIQLKLFNTFGIRLVLQCKSQTIKHLYQQITATTTN